MSNSNISSESQVRYMIQWFQEWSELQRQDFLPILAEKMAANAAYVNGIVNSMGAIDCQDKPMNLFQCRIKLFNEWFSSWSIDDRDKLVRCVTEIDAEFGKKLQDEITGNKQVIEEDTPEPVTVRLPAVENGIQENGDVHEVENQEVIVEEAVVVPSAPLAEPNVAIEITAE